MRKILLLATLFATPALATPNLVEMAYNVRYAETVYTSGTQAIVYVIWYEPSDWEKASQEICSEFDDTVGVFGGSLRAYNQSHGDVPTAVRRDQISSFYCKR